MKPKVQNQGQHFVLESSEVSFVDASKVSVHQAASLSATDTAASAIA